MIDQTRTIFLLDLHIFLVSAASGIIGSSVKSVRDYYGLSNSVFNVLYYGPTGAFLITMPIWYVLQGYYSWMYLLTCTSLVSAAGFALQIGYYNSSWGFWFAVAGCLLTTTSQSFMWTTNSQLINRWFNVKEKSVVYGSFFVSSNAGAILAFLLGRYVLSSSTAFRDYYGYMMGCYAAACVVVAIMSLDLPHIPVPDDDPKTDSDWIHPGRTEHNYQHLLVFVILYVILAGPTWTISSLLTEKLTDHGYSDAHIAMAWLLYSGAALITPFLIGYVMGRFTQYRLTVLIMLILTTIIYIPWIIAFDNLYACLVLTTLLGFTTGATTTMFVETAVELAYPSPGRSWSVLMVFFANINSVLCTLLASFDASLNASQWLFGALFIAGVLVIAADLTEPVAYRRSSPSETHL